MTDFAAFIAEIVALNGGWLRGKTRLQKTAYFLEANKLGYGFDFGYHYYGPYNEDVTIAVDDAWVRDLIDVQKEHTRGRSLFCLQARFPLYRSFDRS